MKKNKIYYILFVLTMLLSLSISGESSWLLERKQVQKRTVYLRVVKNIFDSAKPHLLPKIKIVYGSGYYLGKGKILTDLELTRFSKTIDVHFYDQAKVYRAHVKHQGYDLGLSMLEIRVDKKKETKASVKKKKTPELKKNKKKGDINKSSNKINPVKKEKRRLYLKLLKKTESDVPFINISKPKKKQEPKPEPKNIQEGNVVTKPRVKQKLRTVDLLPLPFSILSTVEGSDLFVQRILKNGQQEGFPLKFEREEFQLMDNSIIDYQWLFSVSRVSQDFSKKFNGSPVLYRGKVVGLFHFINKKKAYVIPANIIRSFLDDSIDGRYDGLKHTGLVYQQVVNPARKNYLGLRKDEAGLEILYVSAKQKISRKILKGDIIISVDQIPLSPHGFMFIEGQRWNVEEYLRSRMRRKESVDLFVVRGKKRMNVSLRLEENTKGHLGRLALKGGRLWFLAMGLVFEKLDYNLAHYLRKKNKYYLFQYYLQYIKKGFTSNNYPVVLRYKFPVRENVGTQDFMYSIVESLNGHRITNLQEFANVWSRIRGDYAIIRFRNREDKLILPYNKSSTVEKKVKTRYKLQENNRVH